MKPAHVQWIRHILTGGGKIDCGNTAAFNALIASGALRGLVVHTLVHHDDDCTPSCCRCDPAYHIEIGTPQNLAAGERAEREWLRQVLS